MDIVSLSGHKVVRTLVKNDRLRAAVARLRRGPAGFVKLPAGAGVQLDGWVMKPAYPNRSHRICEGEGTGLHLYSLLTSYLEKNLPAGAR